MYTFLVEVSGSLLSVKPRMVAILDLNPYILTIKIIHNIGSFGSEKTQLKHQICTL